MGKDTKIEWADHTFNPWMGCTKVSPACDNCYAEARMDTRLHTVQWGAGQPRKRTGESNWREPIKWNKEAAELGVRYRVFCASLADVFDNEVPAQWRADLFALIAATPHLDWLLLTKRIGNAWQMTDDAIESQTWPLSWVRNKGLIPNVWIGATICNQSEADRDIPKLLAVPAAKRFLSLEPLLGAIELRWKPYAHESTGETYREYLDRTGRIDEYEALRKIDWVIVGGESGSNARPMHPDWVRSLRDQCVASGTAFHFKQWGEWRPHPPTRGFDEGAALRSGKVRYLQGDGREPDGHFRKGDAAVIRLGKKAAGRILDNRTWDGVPCVSGTDEVVKSIREPETA